VQGGEESVSVACVCGALEKETRADFLKTFSVGGAKAGWMNAPRAERGAKVLWRSKSKEETGLAESSMHQISGYSMLV
jgi:hypothetical protein